MTKNPAPQPQSKPVLIVRSVNVEKEVWKEAQEKVGSRGMSKLINNALKAYISELK